MTQFQFRAVNGENRTEVGTIAASDTTEAARLLMERGLYPLGVSPEGGGLIRRLNSTVAGSRLSHAEIARFLTDLSHLLHAGLELVPALMTISSTLQRRHGRDFVERLIKEVRTGHGLADAITRLDVSFPRHVVSTIRTGEVSGSLSGALSGVASSMRRGAVMRAKVRTALIYPSCVAVAVAITILVLIGVVVPALESMLADAGQRLPWQTRMLLSAGRFLQEYYLGLAVGAIGSIVAARALLRRSVVKAAAENLVLRLPVIGPFLIAVETARLASMLAMMSAADLPLHAALGMVQDGAYLSISQHSYQTAAGKLREGSRLHEALAEAPTLGARVLALIRIGETTGRLAQLLDEAARDAEEQVSTLVDRGLALLTPVMTLFFGAIAGFVLYAVMTSILSVNDLALGQR